MCFYDFSRPLIDLCLHVRHSMRYHVYADDTQVDLYIVFEPAETWLNVLSRLTCCLNENKSLMTSNMLKLNEEITELITFAPESRIESLAEVSILFCENVFHIVPNVRNLGAFSINCSYFEKQ